MITLSWFWGSVSAVPGDTVLVAGDDFRISGCGLYLGGGGI